jgi:hypothetical protein
MRVYAKTILGCLIALGVLGDLLFHKHGPLTRENSLVYGAFLLFAGVLIAPEDFKGLAFWRKE